MQQDFISSFDMLKVGVGPSSSHTLGPWRAAQQYASILQQAKMISKIDKIQIELFGSLSLTGRGHATDTAVILGLSGMDPTTVDINTIPGFIAQVKTSNKLPFMTNNFLNFDVTKDIIFQDRFLPEHPNGLTFSAFIADKKVLEETYFSIGGGDIVAKNADYHQLQSANTVVPFPIPTAKEILRHVSCKTVTDSRISSLMLANEAVFLSEIEVRAKIEHIWQVMLTSIYTGAHTDGVLPGGLGVQRRAKSICQKLLPNVACDDAQQWLEVLQTSALNFRNIFKWVSCWALAVNETNAALGRVVTAPTNGSAGVIPAVLMYLLCFVKRQAKADDICRFLMNCAAIGSLFKRNATISAAMGGCQAEIGVSSAMAASALTELLGGSTAQCLEAAEIAMEHHLGLTCDPVAGLVQIPCIERNSMGAIKAIHAAEMALERNPQHAIVDLDAVIKTMWQTAQDMHSKYKETSAGGLAVTVGLSSC